MAGSDSSDLVLIAEGWVRKASARYPLTEPANGVLYITVFMADGFNLMSVLYCPETPAFLVISIVDERILEIPLPRSYFAGAVGILACVSDRKRFH